MSLSTGRMTVKAEEAPNAHGPELLLDALLQFAHPERKVLGGRASRMHVADAAARDALERAIGDTGVAWRCTPPRCRGRRAARVHGLRHRAAFAWCDRGRRRDGGGDAAIRGCGRAVLPCRAVAAPDE